MLTCLSCGAAWDQGHEFCPIDGAPLVPELIEKTRLGPYTLLSSLGGGGMARVYRAQAPDGTEVALKVLFRRGEGDDAISRFDREVEILRGLNHPHVVKIFDAGEAEEGARYLSMELLRGEDLSARLKRAGPLPLEEALSLAGQILSALDAVHKAGIVHRDLKPSNIWLKSGEFVHAKLIDFGIARPLDAASRLTAAGKIIGTPAYLAPEQLRGDDLLDNRADLYSFGVTLYEALTGRLPIEAPDAISLMVRVASEPPTPPQVYCPDLPQEISEALLRALEKEPEKRYPTAAAFDEALKAARGQAPTSAQPPSIEAPVLAPEDEARRVTVVVVERVGEGAPAGFVGRAVEALRAAGAMAEPLVGGRVAAVFGTLEKDQEAVGRAISCALALRHPAVRIGISTDPLAVAAGHDLGGAGATRLAASARGGEIRVDEETFLQVKEWVELDGEEDGAYLVRGSRLWRSRMRQVLGVETPTVGRETELARIRAAIGGTNRARRPRGLLLLGEEGIGKSRLLADARALGEKLVPEALVLVAQAEPMRQGEPFGLFSSLLSSCAGPPLLPTAEPLRQRPVPLDPGQRRSRLSVEDGIFAWLSNLAAERLLLLVLEDLHFADVFSLKMLNRVLQSAVVPIVVLATARNDGEHDSPVLSLLRQASRIELLPLGGEQVVSLLQAILDAPPPEPLWKRVLEVSQGNPFLIEEFLRALADTGQLKQRNNGIWQLSGTLTGTPSSFEDILTARFSALLPEEKELLKRASVFGERFFAEALPSLGIVKPTALLEPLQDREFLASENWSGQVVYRFRHAAVQRFLYESLPQEDRAALHRGAGRWLREQREYAPALLAWHAESGDRPRKALRYLYELGLTSFLRGAEEEALSFFNHAISLADLPEDLFDLIVDREEILYLLGRYEESWQDVSTLFSLLERLPDTQRRVRALLREGRLLAAQEPEQARASLEEALALASELEDQLSLAECYHLLGVVWRQMGELEQSLRASKRALRLAQELGRKGLELDAVEQLAELSRDLGDYARAIRAAERGLALARRQGDRARESFLVATLGMLANTIGRFEEAEAHLREALSLSGELASPEERGKLQAQLGRALVHLGRIDDAIAFLEEARASGEHAPPEALGAVELSLAEALWARGAPGDSSQGAGYAEAAINRCLGTLQEIQGRIGLARWRLSRRDLEGAFYDLERAEELRQRVGALGEEEERLSYTWHLALYAAGRYEEAQNALLAAVELVQDRAERISEEEMRRSYLELVPLCREIMNTAAG